MFRILLDENIPAALRRLLPGHQVSPAYEMGWSSLANGDLIVAAEAEKFDVMITADRNIQYQQNLTNRTVALVVLSTNDWPTIRDNIGEVLSAIEPVVPGSYSTVQLPRPTRRRRPYTPSLEG